MTPERTKGEGRMPVLVQVFGLITDEENKTPVVILRAVEGDETLPIQIGVAEATAILVALHGTEMPRPMTHDLLNTVIRTLGGVVEKVEVVDLREGTFYGVLHVRKGRGVVTVDSRPSDAIALALRAKAPIYVADQVFRKAQPSDVTEASRQHWMSFLHALESLEDKKDLVD